MTGPFDTVADAEEWLEEEPSVEEVEEAIAVEEDQSSPRTTALEAFRAYLPDDDEEADTVEFDVLRPFDGHTPDETLRLDPDSDEAARLRRAGYIRVA